MCDALKEFIQAVTTSHTKLQEILNKFNPFYEEAKKHTDGIAAEMDGNPGINILRRAEAVKNSEFNERIIRTLH